MPMPFECIYSWELVIGRKVKARVIFYRQTAARPHISISEFKQHEKKKQFW